MLRGCGVAERNFAKTVDTTEEGGTVVSKVCGRLCVATGGVTLVGRGGKNPKGGVQVKGGTNKAAQRSIRLMVTGRNISWDRIPRLEMTAETRDGFCCWRRESEIRILKILIPRQYSCRVWPC